ncbi:hypothetical protein [Methylosinus sp. LW4]|uniref:hypothetical protein n=1 Tax=Methylosinus sp. LW4 TaxID=136993 RepID=UPI00036C200E|nr:hypothetical protein [Methylosinus sp. LW4]
MGLSKADFRDRDIYVDYPFEDVMFRFDSKTGSFFQKFYGAAHEAAVPHDNRLLTEAILQGEEIDAAAYHAGKK